METGTASFDLTDKVAIITGASKGIGEAIARQYASAGAKVVVSSRAQEAVDLVANSINKDGFQAIGIAAHMGDESQIADLVSKTMEKWGRIDIVVNNAAINPVFGPLVNTDLSVFDKIMAVNVKGPLLLAKLAHPHMRKSGAASVINISSIEGISPGMGLGLYSVSKAALISMSKVMANEWAEDDIRVNVICPGLIKTKFSKALTDNEQILKYVLARQSIKRPGTVAEIAGLAHFLAAPAASFCTGAVFTADGGYTT